MTTRAHAEDLFHDQHEVEWQFDAVDLRPVERWLRRPEAADGLVVVPGPTLALTDRYFDTEDWRIYRAGYTLRIRRRAGRYEATMKALSGSVDGLRDRREITLALESDDAKELASGDGPLSDRVRAVAGPRQLRGIFEIRTRRTVFDVTPRGRHGPAAEVALDRTIIPLGEGEEPARLRRVEIEATTGEAGELGGFVAGMCEACALQPAALSKFEAAVLARGLEPNPTLDLGPMEITSDRSIGEVAFAVLRRHFAAQLTREPGTRLGEDAEELHDMRVATRRLRAALSQFAAVLPVRAGRLRDELGWLGGLLGAVRDLDVQLEQARSWRGEFGDPVEPLEDLLEAQRAQARTALLAALDSRRYERLVLGLTAMLRQGPLRRSPASRTPALAVAPELIGTAARRVRKRARRIRPGDPSADFHQLRIRSKRLRYAVESLADLYGEPARDVVRRATAIQDLLGHHQDAIVATARLRDMVAGRGHDLPPATVFLMGQVAERYRRAGEQLQTKLPGVYGKFRRPWARLRRAMDRSRPAGWPAPPKGPIDPPEGRTPPSDPPPSV